MMKKRLGIFLAISIALSSILIGCGSEDSSNQETGEIPKLNVGYVFTNHQTPLMVAASKGEDFKDSGLYLEEVISKEKYNLIEGDKAIAEIDLVVSNSGSESMTLMGQGTLDVGLASSAAYMNAIDQGSSLKMLCPVHTEGIGLVMDKESELEGWEGFLKLLEESQEPIIVGYHSPTSAPIMLLEAALEEAGIDYTKDPENKEADILLSDLKGTSNLIPALTSGQVDAWVGPSPYPELAVTEGVGKIILDMKDLPPKGEWHDFPCCVVGATDTALESYPEEIDALVELISISADYSQENPSEAAQITSDFTGVSVEAAEMSSIKYTTDPTESWISNLGLVYGVLKDTDNFTGKFLEKSYTEAEEDLFDFGPIKKALEKN